ncbi:MAG: hypothetical protein Q8Q62_18705 [Mesorhizobium sp.]|nr:hypothetical protein [Mesorhizobium sp.]
MTIRRTGGIQHPLPELIRDQLHDATNLRFLRAMPVFQPVTEGQDIFDRLLQRLDAVESGSKKVGNRRD